MTKNKRVRNYKATSKVILVFTSMVFVTLLATMLIVGFAMYTMLQRDVVTILKPDTIELLVVFFLSSSIIIGTLISVIIGKILLNDLDKVVEGMQDLTRGNYDVRVPTVKSGFSKDLVDNFNILANELENTQSLRSDFINDFAHEFKTPIVSISGFAKLLKNEKLTDEQRAEYLNVIIEEADRLSMLSTNALNFTKVEKQTILSGETYYNLAEQIRTCVLILEKKWTSKNLEPDLELEEVTVFANEELLKQVLINLIDNAIKFSFDNTAFTIVLKKVGNGVLFSIKNCGVRITDEEKRKIFNRFYRSQNSNGIEGNGVGLAIVKKIVELHGGTVEVDNGEEYTEFKVFIPNNIE